MTAAAVCCCIHTTTSWCRGEQGIQLTQPGSEPGGISSAKRSHLWNVNYSISLRKRDFPVGNADSSAFSISGISFFLAFQKYFNSGISRQHCLLFQFRAFLFFWHSKIISTVAVAVARASNCAKMTTLNVEKMLRHWYYLVMNHRVSVSEGHNLWMSIGTWIMGDMLNSK